MFCGIWEHKNMIRGHLHVFSGQISSLDDAKVERSVSGHVTEDLLDLELLWETSWSEPEAQVRRGGGLKTLKKTSIHKWTDMHQMRTPPTRSKTSYNSIKKKLYRDVRVMMMWSGVSSARRSGSIDPSDQLLYASVALIRLYFL